MDNNITKNNTKKHIYEKKPPHAPLSASKMPIFKSAYYQKVLSSKNRSNSCENNGNLIDVKTRILSDNGVEQNADFELNQEGMIKVGIVENLRRKFLDNGNTRPPGSSIRTSLYVSNVKKTKLSESNDMSTVSLANIKIEKDDEIKLLSPSSEGLYKSEIKKVAPLKFHNSRLKSIERSLSTSAHIDDAFKLVKQSLVS